MLKNLVRYSAGYNEDNGILHKRVRLSNWIVSVYYHIVSDAQIQQNYKQRNEYTFMELYPVSCEYEYKMNAYDTLFTPYYDFSFVLNTNKWKPTFSWNWL